MQRVLALRHCYGKRSAPNPSVLTNTAADVLPPCCDRPCIFRSASLQQTREHHRRPQGLTSFPDKPGRRIAAAFSAGTVASLGWPEAASFTVSASGEFCRPRPEIKKRPAAPDTAMFYLFIRTVSSAKVNFLPKDKPNKRPLRRRCQQQPACGYPGRFWKRAVIAARSRNNRHSHCSYLHRFTTKVLVPTAEPVAPAPATTRTHSRANLLPQRQTH